MSMIEITALEKRYGTLSVLRGVTLSVPHGSVYALLGPNGSGKTTTLRILTGLARSTSGRVLIAGEDATAPRARRHLGALIEAPALYPHLTGLENLRVYARDRRVGPARLREVLDMVGLAHAANRLAGQYSLGMKQRLGIALAMLGEPGVLVLDEPQNGLDPQGMRGMRELLSALHARGFTLLVSSHLLHEVQLFATHVGVMMDGRVAFEGTTRELTARTVDAVRVEVGDAQRAASVLAALDPELRVEGQVLTLRAEAALVARALVLGGVDVQRLERTGGGLEEHYFDLTTPQNVGVGA